VKTPIRGIAVLAIGVCVSFQCSFVNGEEITYRVSGLLEEGGWFDGTFRLDTDALDQEDADGRGQYRLFDVGVLLVDTELFFSGGNDATSGFSTEAFVFQHQVGQRQSLLIYFGSDTGNSGVFSGIDFEPFTDDADVLHPIASDKYVGGYFDGAGVSPIVEFDLEIVPEPSTFTILTMAAIGLAIGWWRQRGPRNK